jgi:hypothetical protein
VIGSSRKASIAARAVVGQFGIRNLLAPFTSGSKWRYYDPSVIAVLGWALRLFFDLFVRLSSVDAASAADKA